MSTKFSENSETKCEYFYCETCDYKCLKKQHIKQHFMSQKHKIRVFNKKPDVENSVNDTENGLKSYFSKNFVCNCGKVYKDRSGLWRHVKLCSKIDISSKDFDYDYDNNSDTPIEINNVEINNDFKITTQMFYDLLKQNNELQKTIIDLTTKQTMGNNNTVNSNNKTFNLQVFLNETCKDALNLTEFVNQIQLSISDLEETGKLGYAEGISKVFIKNLNGIDYTKRPIHCSDSKRETLYIKNENEWTKDDENKSNIKNAIKQVANKNIKNITEWQKKYPEYSDPDSKQNDKYMKIVLNSMSGSTKEEANKNYEKIVKNIAKEVIIDK
jgi:hypothetical protein